MPRWATSIDSPHELRVRTSDDRDLVFLTGTAYIEGFSGPELDGTMDWVWDVDDLYIPVGSRWHSIDDVTVVVSLAELRNDHGANWAGWSARHVRWAKWNDQLLIMADIGIRDSDGYLQRVAYQATAVGTLL
jgi:hypothetical protein